MSQEPPIYLTGFAPAERSLDELLNVLLHGEPYQAKRAADDLRAKFDMLNELLIEEQRENEHLRGKLQPTQAEQDEWRRVTGGRK